ncbi:gamma-butyrobetaine hydroxylase [Exidia glandulosa HHB12029]|uniref:Gamma-butyrobetaine hydroxylase n=1 Tax=Exidia glandulosa HHB12029 TaxID=1314781 RepID=A0A165HQW7_EXIGL|nr:gamma-butyrobetaine hydroxylase [Exidia glandulosa HHB12029]
MILRAALPHVSRRIATRWLSSTATLSSPKGLTIASLGSFPFRWLRDACPCPECVHPSTRQKLHASSDIPRDIQPVGPAQFVDDTLTLRWPGHRKDSVYGRKYLLAYSTHAGTRDMHGDRRLAAKPWTADELAKEPALYIGYEALKSDDRTRLKAYEHLARTGLLFVTDVPHTITSDEECELRNLASIFGEIRETFYGRTWDVIAKRGSTNIAYTSLFLGLHMDLQYFAHPPRFQLLHCLRNRVVGGTSLFLDALSAAERLRKTNPSAFATLTTVPVPFHYQNAGHHLHHSHTTIELDKFTGEIAHINYAPPFQAPFPSETPDALYDALGAFVKVLEEEGRTFKYLLREGDVAVFDNRRVLHAREAFEDPAETSVEEGQPSRWLKGCYLEADALLDRARVLRKKI